MPPLLQVDCNAGLVRLAAKKKKNVPQLPLGTAPCLEIEHARNLTAAS